MPLASTKAALPEFKCLSIFRLACAFHQPMVREEVPEGDDGPSFNASSTAPTERTELGNLQLLHIAMRAPDAHYRSP
jgi:hypothetical protein